MAGSVSLGGASFSIQSAATILVAGALVSLQYLVFYRTQIGRRLARRSGGSGNGASRRHPRLHPDRGDVWTWNGACRRLRGDLANQFFVSPTGGISLSAYAYIAVVIGGWGSISGAVMGAMIIAFFQVLASLYVPYTVASGGLYVALLVILFFRPQGTFGERVQKRV